MSRIRPGRQSQNRNSQLAYESLEPRCVLTGPHQVFVPLPEGTNLVQNENFSAINDVVVGFFGPHQVPHWQAVQPTGTEPKQALKVLDFPGQGPVLELDANAGLNQVYQDVPTNRGNKYLLSFDFRAHPLVYQQGLDVTTTQFQVRWNGAVVANVQPGFNWKTISVEVQGGNGDTSRLMFSELENLSSDGVGALINRVRLVEVTQEQVPNGDFEQYQINPRTLRNYFQVADVPNWDAISPTDLIVMRLQPTMQFPKSRFGSRILNLNSHNGFRDSVFQDLKTESDALYYVQFSAYGNGSEQLRVRWDNSLALIVHPEARWESIGLLVKATDDLTNLTFVEGNANNGNIWIDNVKIFRVHTPTFASRAAALPLASNPALNYSVLSSVVDDEAENKRRLPSAALS